MPLHLGYIITHCQLPDYSWTIVGLADRSNLWVMSRSPQMDPAQYAVNKERYEAAQREAEAIAWMQKAEEEKRRQEEMRRQEEVRA